MLQWISTSPTIHQYRTGRPDTRERRKSSLTSLLLLSNSQFFTEPLYFLTQSFCPLDTIAFASFTRPTFVSSLIDVFLFFLRRFRFFGLVHGVFPSSPWKLNSRIPVHLLASHWIRILSNYWCETHLPVQTLILKRYFYWLEEQKLKIKPSKFTVQITVERFQVASLL